MTSEELKATELKLRAARRTEEVSPALHDAVLTAVSRAQRDERVHSHPRRHFGWGPALGSAALASMLLAVWLGPLNQPVERGPAAPVDPAAQALTRMLDDRLAQPLDKLQALQEVKPLESELAALESDLAKMKPRWPWQPDESPAG